MEGMYFSAQNSLKSLVRTISMTWGAGDGERQGNEGSCEIEEQVSTLQAEPRGSAHQDERAAQQEVSGQDGRSEERFIAVASTAAADGRQRAQHSEADPQPSRCAAHDSDDASALPATCEDLPLVLPSLCAGWRGIIQKWSSYSHVFGGDRDLLELEWACNRLKLVKG